MRKIGFQQAVVRTAAALTLIAFSSLFAAASSPHPLVSAPPETESAKAHYEQGNTFRDMEQYEKAINEYTRALQLNPGMTAAYLSRGNVFRLLGDYQRSRNDLDKVLASSPENPVALCLRGIARRGLARRKDGSFDPTALQAALTDFDHALKIRPDYWEALTEKAVAQLSLEHLDDARATLTTVITQTDTASHGFDKQVAERGEAAYAYFWRANSYAQQHDWEHAQSDIDRAIVLDRRDYLYILRRGEFRIAQNQPVQAIPDCNKALELNPQSWEAYSERGIAYTETHDYKNAISDFGSSIDLKPDQARTYYLRAQAYRDAGQPTAALIDTGRALSLDPTDKDALFLQAVVRAETGDFKGGIADEEKLLAREPDNLAIYQSLAFLYLLHEDWTKSSDAYAKALSAPKASPHLHLYRAIAIAMNGDVAGARTECRAGIVGATPSQRLAVRERAEKLQKQYPGLPALEEVLKILQTP